MKKTMLVFLSLLLSASFMHAEIHDFTTIQGNLGNGFYVNAVSSEVHEDAFQQKGGFAVGAEVESNIGQSWLWHAGLMGAIPLAESLGGPKADVGVSYILSSDVRDVGFFGMFFGETVNTSVTGTSTANFIMAVDIGSRIYAHWYLAEFTDRSQKYGDVAEIIDNCSYYNLMAYTGLRYLSVYAAFMPLNQIDVSIHGLVGLVTHNSIYKATDKYPPDDFVPIDQTIDDPHLAYGVEICLRWWLFDFIVGYYDSDFYLDASAIINFNIF